MLFSLIIEIDLITSLYDLFDKRYRSSSHRLIYRQYWKISSWFSFENMLVFLLKRYLISTFPG